MMTARIILVIGIYVCYGVDICFGYHSCRDLKISNPSVPSGEYFMSNGYGQSFAAYCDFKGNNGYMFIRRDAGVSINIAKIAPSTNAVLVRHRRTNGKQYDTSMEQISGKSSVPLSIQFNQNLNYARPLNHAAANLAPYLYLGFLPIAVAQHKTVQGYRANGRDFTFKNCDANPNSYLAFFFNPRNRDPTNYHTKCCYNDLMRDWINAGNQVSTGDYLPLNYFFQFEMHMGGCGGYAINGYSKLSDIVGAALGIPFKL